MNREEQIKSQLDNLIKAYEQELGFLQNRDMSQFDINMLPPIIRDMVKLAVNKTPSFSNISAVAVANFVLNNTFGQLRPKIEDAVYSTDSLGINSYAILLSSSG